MDTNRILCRFAIAATGVTLAAGLALAAPASAAETTVAATFRCTEVDVTSSRHDLSNVVLVFADGHQKFEGLGGDTKARTFAGTGDFAGDVIEGVYIKAGENGTGAGPGYGEFVDAPDGSNCAAASGTGTDVDGSTNDNRTEDEPKKKGADGSKRDGDARDEVVDDSRVGDDAVVSGADHQDATVGATFACGNTSVTVTSTKDLSNVVLRLSDGTDVKHQGLSGSTRTFTAPDGTTITAVFIKSGDNGSGEGPGYGERVDAATTSCTEATTVVVPSAVTETPVVQVQPAAVLAAAEEAPAIAAAAAAAAAEAPVKETEVLGVALERSAPAAAPAALARTGMSILTLLAAAMGLLAGGVFLVRRSRRSVA